MKPVTVTQLNEAAEFLRMVGYGEPGTGKTTLGASGCLDESTSPTLFVEYRAQIAALRSNTEYLEAMKDGRLVIASIEKYSELDYVYTWLKRGRGSQRQLDKIFADLGHADDVMPKVVVIDSITELQRSEVMRRAGNAPGIFLTNVEAPLIQHWGQLLNQFTLLAHLFFQLPYHVIFSGLETVDYAKRVVGEAQRVTGYRLALQGQAIRQFPAYALTLMRLERAPQNTQEAFNIGYTQSVMAKTKEQTGMIPAKIVNPTIPKLVKFLQGG